MTDEHTPPPVPDIPWEQPAAGRRRADRGTPWGIPPADFEDDDTAPAPRHGSALAQTVHNPPRPNEPELPSQGPGEPGSLDDLDDLFGDDEETASEQPTAASEPTEPTETAEAAPEPAGSRTSPPPGAIVEATAPQAAGPAQPEPTPPSATQPREAALRRAMARKNKLDRLDVLFPMADQVQAFVGDDPELQQIAARMELHRDPVHDQVQFDEFQRRLEDRFTRATPIPGLDRSNIDDVVKLAYDELLGIGPLGDLWRDEDVTEILVRSWDEVWVERDSIGGLERDATRFKSPDHANTLARRLAAKVSDRALSPTNQLVTAELPGARVQFCYGNIVKSGLSIAIRKFRPLLDLDKLLSIGALNHDMSAFLRDCVAARATVLVSGGTGTGKTTMINALSEFIGHTENVITIEDAFELTLTNPLVTSMQTREKASADDTVVVRLADLLTASLRMRPDRIIVGEIREGVGASVMLKAASTGHDGTMTTIHANSAESAVNDRFPDMLLEHQNIGLDVARRNVATAINLVVQVTRKHGRRYISQIAVVDRSQVNAAGHIDPQLIFTGDSPSRSAPVTFRRVGAPGADTELGIKLADAGLLERWERTP